MSSILLAVAIVIVLIVHICNADIISDAEQQNQQDSQLQPQPETESTDESRIIGPYYGQQQQLYQQNYPNQGCIGCNQNVPLTSGQFPEQGTGYAQRQPLNYAQYDDDYNMYNNMYPPVNHATFNAYMCGTACGDHIRRCSIPCNGALIRHRCIMCIGVRWDECLNCFLMHERSGIGNPFNTINSMGMGAGYGYQYGYRNRMRGK